MAQFQILYSVLRPAAQTGGWENSHPGKPWPQGGKSSLPGLGARLLSPLLLGPAVLSPTPLLPGPSGAERPPGFDPSGSRRGHSGRHRPLGGQIPAKVGALAQECPIQSQLRELIQAMPCDVSTQASAF